jgi:hypothetical protein
MNNAATGPMPGLRGVKCFSATMQRERDSLGEKVSAWLADSRYEPLSVVVTQSSDEAFHCLTITVFYK